MKIDKMSELLTARETLQALSQISFTFATLNKRFPIGEIQDEQAIQLLGQYNNLILKVKVSVNQYEIENEGEHDAKKN